MYDILVIKNQFSTVTSAFTHSVGCSTFWIISTFLHSGQVPYLYTLLSNKWNFSWGAITVGRTSGVNSISYYSIEYPNFTKTIRILIKNIYFITQQMSLFYFINSSHSIHSFNGLQTTYWLCVRIHYKEYKYDKF